MNKLHQFFYIIIEFFIILIFFTIIPIFLTSESNTQLNFSIYDIFYYGILSLMLYFLPLLIGKTNQTDKNHKYTNKIIISIVVLIMMLLIQYLLSILEKKVVNNIIVYPKINFSILIFFTIFVRAVFEEILFRYYFIKRKIYFIQLCPNKILDISLEIIFILLFGFCHINMGFFSVINGIFAGLLLRFLYKFCNKIYFNIFIHFIYNLIIFFF